MKNSAGGAMEEALGIKVKRRWRGTEYSVGIEGMASGNIDVMLVSPMSYYQAKEKSQCPASVSTPMASNIIQPSSRRRTMRKSIRWRI